MSRLNRSLVVLLVAAVMLAALGVAWGSTRQVEAQADGTATDAGPLILVGQKPRLQEFFAGDDATFTVGITNTGTVALQGVSVSNATTPSCNRTDQMCIRDSCKGFKSPGCRRTARCGATTPTWN